MTLESELDDALELMTYARRFAADMRQHVDAAERLTAWCLCRVGDENGASHLTSARRWLMQAISDAADAESLVSACEVRAAAALAAVEASEKEGRVDAGASLLRGGGK
jgi:hypothetical protein